MEIDGGEDICGIPGKNKYRRERDVKKYFKLLFRVLAAVFCVALPVRYNLPDKIYTSDRRQAEIGRVPEIKLIAKDRRIYADRTDARYDAKLFGLIKVKEVTVSQKETRYVAVSGEPFGLKMFCDGVMVVGFSDILTADGYKNPAKNAGLKIGDIVTAINGKKVQTNEDVGEIISKCRGQEITVEYLRNDTEKTAQITAVYDKNIGAYRSGMWVRDSSAGIGTMTFYDIEKGLFAGLGHGIKDIDTGKEIRLLSGETVPVKITGVTKSKNGSAGRLKGSFSSVRASGKILKNTSVGVYGKIYSAGDYQLMPVANEIEIKPGKAYILTCIDGQEPKSYEIQIEKIYLNSKDRTKNMVIKITDKELLDKTGGIVRGMSGSPIIQNGKLVGAVTHVFVNRVHRGYRIFAQNMLTALDSAEENTK